MAKRWSISDAREAGFRVTKALRLQGEYEPKLLEEIQPVVIVSDATTPGQQLLAGMHWQASQGTNSVDAGLAITAPPGVTFSLEWFKWCQASTAGNTTANLLISVAPPGAGTLGVPVATQCLRTDPIGNHRDAAPVQCNFVVNADSAGSFLVAQFAQNGTAPPGIQVFQDHLTWVFNEDNRLYVICTNLVAAVAGQFQIGGRVLRVG